MARVQLREVAQARSGDKGDTSDITLFAPTAGWFEIFKQEVTVERVKELFGPVVKGSIERYEAPNVWALKFVCHNALGGGAPLSLRSDNLGKCLGPALLRLNIEVPDDAIEEISGNLRASAAGFF